MMTRKCVRTLRIDKAVETIAAALYVKLALRNARRSVSDSLVYIVTLTSCVTLFYAFLSITSSFYHPDIGAEFDLTALSGAVRLAICMVTLLILFLIRYVNCFMLRRMSL